MTTRAIALDFYGVTAVVMNDHPDIERWLRFDFSYFIVPEAKNPAVTIEAQVSEPPWNIIPELVESMRAPDYVCFDSDHLRFVNYSGRALVRFDYRTESAQMYGQEPAYLYEKLYLLLLSRTGELLDRRGIHRVHGLAVAVNGQASLFLMPSGGGKSTLALSLLKDPQVTLLSEDTPLLDQRAEIYPFPLRLGLSQRQIPSDAPEDLVRPFHRDRGGTKYLLHIDYFKGKIQAERVPLCFIFAGKWINSNTPRIQRISRFSIFLTLMRDCVFGLGLPQIVEFFLTSNPIDLVRKTGIALRRIFSVLRLSIRAVPHRLLLSKDTDANKAAVMAFLHSKPL